MSVLNTTMTWDFPNQNINARFRSNEMFLETNKLAHDLWYWQLLTAVHALGDLIIVEI